MSIVLFFGRKCVPTYAGMKRIIPYGLRDENCVMVNSIKESIGKKPKRIENVSG